MKVKTFYDKQTATFTHIVIDEDTKHCAIIDSVLDYDQDAAKFTTDSADAVIEYIKTHQLTNQWILETHIHADHITAAFYLKEHVGGKTAIGTGIKDVLKMWVPLFNQSDETPITGEQFDQLFDDNESFKIGNLRAEIFHTPGHTPACSTYHIEDAIFVGDTLFAPRMGTARVDFPGGSARDLYESIQKMYQLPDETKVYLCHDYPGDDQQPISMTTVGEQKANNKMLKENTTLEEFVAMREARDKTLAVPKLILPSLQTNMRLGSFGPKSANGIQYLTIPVNVL
ncbi:MBL fold metallo-hydrolase [Marinicella sp. S1101]|uniref:MBL fold metallo-hydrolase n=1 Tax=Marinicella marina TaxID=2996016 RepID=UPI002260D879|nr:MBL fold metallo-hydrolase [Marinicella marina]MCX7554188.1 MBL fold metallo-hydrolase [Marinicella marina]MDJ1141119.1 MBL fold metallo-hydrolase [Marinicella marina]